MLALSRLDCPIALKTPNMGFLVKANALHKWIRAIAFRLGKHTANRHSGEGRSPEG